MPDNSIVQGCLANIRHESKLMRDSLGEGHLLPALKHCSNFLNELRTSQLSPKEYYELYMAVFDSLESLSAYLLQSHKSKQAKNKNSPFLTDLYELVQYLGNIIPRLYMMIVIGTTYMSANDTATKDIMKDMLEMCRGVQHPIRGLFLRHYLSQRTKNLFPLATTEDFTETVDFLVVNFIEMNKLWVRLQHQGHSSERELRYQERKELKILVGSNLVRLSQVIDDFKSESYSSVEFYRDNIFPTITEQIIQCRDHLAQSYLIDVLIQIFPDDFHFLTLDSLLNDVFLKLHPLLKKSELVSTLVDRFVTFHKYESDLANDTENLQVDELSSKATQLPIKAIFESFWTFYENLQEAQPELPAEEYCSILQSLIKLSLTFDPDNYENLDKIYKFATGVLGGNNTDDSSDDNQSLWKDLLITPVQHFSSTKRLLQLSFFYELFNKVTNVSIQKQIASEIADKLLSNEEREYLTTPDEIDDIYKYLMVLIMDSDSRLSTSKDLGVLKAIEIEGGEKHITEAFLEMQEKVSKTLHLVEHPDYFKTLNNLLFVKKKYLSKNPGNVVFLYPTLILRMTNILRIAGYKKIRMSAESSDQVELMITSNFKTISVVIDELYQKNQQFNAELALKLYLNLASTADQLQHETIAYELFNQCFVVFEESMVLSNLPRQTINPHESMGGAGSYQSILEIANRLSHLRYFNKENYESLITKITLYGSKLLKKQDQCRSVYYCAHLWWWCDLWIDGPSPTVAAKENEGEEKAEADVEQANEEEDTEKPLLYRDAKRVLECLQKSLRVADSCMDPYLLLKLFVEILNRCLIFSVYGNWLVDLRYVNGLIDLIRTNLSNFRDELLKVEDDQEARLLRQIEAFFQRTLAYIRDLQVAEDQFPDIIV